jgi:hypothetical protein
MSILKQIAAILHPKKKTYTTMEFLDIAGLVKGASRGEGLGSEDDRNDLINALYGIRRQTDRLLVDMDAPPMEDAQDRCSTSYGRLDTAPVQKSPS